MNRHRSDDGVLLVMTPLEAIAIPVLIFVVGMLALCAYAFTEERKEYAPVASYGNCFYFVEAKNEDVLPGKGGSAYRMQMRQKYGGTNFHGCEKVRVFLPFCSGGAIIHFSNDLHATVLKFRSFEEDGMFVLPCNGECRLNTITHW